jgi:hypothetical protein
MLLNKTLQLGRTIRRLTSFLACDKKLLERGKGHNLLFSLVLEASEAFCANFVSLPKPKQSTFVEKMRDEVPGSGGDDKTTPSGR